PHVRAGAGAVATQNITDPNLGPLLLDRLEAGDDADAALAAVMAGREHLEFRQLTVVDASGNTASHTGGNILGTNSVAEGEDCLAAGNLLSDVGVTRAMADGFAANAGEHLAERLLRALEAGVDAGGEMGPVRSACLLVADQLPFPLVDLRVDWSEAGPIAELRGLWQAYEPQMRDYVNRAVNPSAAPSYGVPGDE
ncbi:MAG: DUF1028 domain-containing protein, partial [Hyphomicrobiales bacterium]